MDPISLISLIEGSISLALQCESVAKNLNSLAGQYKYAKLTILSTLQNLDTMQLAWKRIGQWSRNLSPDEDPESQDFIERLARCLETGRLVMDALEEELQVYDSEQLSFAQRSKLVWNEGIFLAHQIRVRDQASSMTMLLHAIQL